MFSTNIHFKGNEYGDRINVNAYDFPALGYGDGRAVSVLEAIFKGKRWEMQLKGGGKTPYCRVPMAELYYAQAFESFLPKSICTHSESPQRALCVSTPQHLKQLSKPQDVEALSAKMKRINPKYTWRDLQQVLTKPYDEQTPAITEKYYQIRSEAFFNSGGVSHYSCSS